MGTAARSQDSEASKMLELAVAHFTGWREARSGGTIISLVESMGLTEQEWKQLKKSGDAEFLWPADVGEIDEYFEEVAGA